jgi:hypothetical protein
MPAQQARVAEGLCAAPGCGRPVHPGSPYCCLGPAGQACRQRARRERRRWEASDDGARHLARRRLEVARAMLRELEAELARLAQRRTRLQALVEDLVVRSSGQVELPVLASGSLARRVRVPSRPHQAAGGESDA